MKKIILALAILFVLVLMGAYLSYKIYIMNYYNINSLRNYDEYSENLYDKGEINIKTNKLNESEYLLFNNVKIRNDFNNFVKLDEPHSTDEYVKYVLYDENNNVLSSLWVSIGQTYTEMLESEIFVFNSSDTKYEEIDMTKFFKDKSIVDDIKLFKYLIETKDKNNNMFQTLEEMKSNYSLHFLIDGILPDTEGITFINGDYNGYIFDYKSNYYDVKEVNILKDNKRYSFTFLGNEYFTDKYIKELLNTIVIK